jgi:LCP family protein required for cell wall assembly
MQRTVILSVLALALVTGAAFATRPVHITGASSHGLVAILKAPYLALTGAFGSDRDADGKTTVLILGKAGAGWTAGELTDTIIVASLDGEANRAMLLSIPRDLLVRMDGYQGKINSLWLVGKQDAQRRGESDVAAMADLIHRGVEQITGIGIDEIVVVDVTAAETIVDRLGGIALQVDNAITDPRYPTPGGGTERFTIEPGFHVLNGSTAVKYARTRHTPEGDFGRIRRQHQVAEAIVNKAKGLSLLSDLGIVTGLFNDIASHTETTITIGELPGLAALARDIPFSNLETYALETLQARGGSEPLLTSAGFAAGLIPRAGFYDYSEIHERVAELITVTP